MAHPDGGASRRRQARQAIVRGEADDAAVDQALRSGRAAEVLEQLAATGWRFLLAADPAFPEPLAALADPPLGLFVRGELPDRPAVAVVGARRCSAYGREVAEYLGRELAAGGACVVSGMARGVDGAAHRGALAGGGATVAVWGAGPDRVYPSEHAVLAEEIAGSGALVTEYPPGSPPLAAHFPERNRLIAGLAKVVVVVEADERSGALVTARLALDEGRDVMAVPGSVFSRLSAGPNGLLRAGAAPVLSAVDVLTVLGLAAAKVEPAEPDFLKHVPAGAASTVDELAARSGLPVARLLELLLELELGGFLARDADGRYRRSHVRACRSDVPPESQA